VSLAVREDFKAIFECRSFKEAKAYFDLRLNEVKEAIVKKLIKIAEMFKNHFDVVRTHYGTDGPMQKQKGLCEKFKRSIPLMMCTKHLIISECLSTSSVVTGSLPTRFVIELYSD